MNHQKIDLPTADWGTIRPIYQRLSGEFHILTSPYQIKLDKDTQLMLDHLIIAIDEIDQFVDDLPTKEERESVTQVILNHLKGTDNINNVSAVSNSFAQKIETISAIVKELQVENRFVEAAAKIFYYTEAKRHEMNTKEFINLVMLEGNATAVLPLSIMQIPAEHDFSIFFAEFCKLMGIADLIVDAKEDYKSNCILIKPSFKLYMSLVYLLLTKGLYLLWIFPKKLRFLWYCIKFSFVLLSNPK